MPSSAVSYAQKMGSLAATALKPRQSDDAIRRGMNIVIPSGALAALLIIGTFFIVLTIWLAVCLVSRPRRRVWHVGGSKITMKDMDRLFPEWVPAAPAKEEPPRDRSESLPKSIDAVDQEEPCAICLEPMDGSGDPKEAPLRTLNPCGHTFHSKCIIRWLTGVDVEPARRGRGDWIREIRGREESGMPVIGTHAVCPVCKFNYFEFLRYFGDGSAQVAMEWLDRSRSRRPSGEEAEAAETEHSRPPRIVYGA